MINHLPKNATPLKGQLEQRLFFEQNRSTIGVDEVGRGCIAGPVVTAAASIDYHRLSRLSEEHKLLIRDSKTLSLKQRQKILPIIKSISIDCEIGLASVREIEAYGILDATFLAMRRALHKCNKNYDLLLIDGKIKLRGYDKPQMAIIGGDGICYNIAAASIVAKIHRDELMWSQAKSYPHYGFDTHVGYGTKKHLAMIHEHGFCTLHRKNFAPIRHMTH